MDDWIDYYDSTHTIYASKRHRDLHFEIVARDIVGYIPSLDAVVLDYACGEALAAAKVADACSTLFLAEPAELDTAFAVIRRLLKPAGRLVLGDILRPNVGMARDVIALLRFAAKCGFLKDALIGLLSTALSDYRHLRTRLGLQRYGEKDMIAKLAKSGLSAERAPFNIGHNPWRMTFVARLAFSLPPD
jgi:SAM-dependent methyltransferase